MYPKVWYEYSKDTGTHLICIALKTICLGYAVMNLLEMTSDSMGEGEGRRERRGGVYAILVWSVLLLSFSSSIGCQF